MQATGISPPRVKWRAGRQVSQKLQKHIHPGTSCLGTSHGAVCLLPPMKASRGLGWADAEATWRGKAGEGFSLEEKDKAVHPGFGCGTHCSEESSPMPSPASPFLVSQRVLDTKLFSSLSRNLSSVVNRFPYTLSVSQQQPKTRKRQWSTELLTIRGCSTWAIINIKYFNI